MATEEEFKEATRFYFSIIGQSWFFGFIFAILLSESLEVLEGIGILTGLLLVWILSRIFQLILIWINYSQYRYYENVVKEFTKDKDKE